MGEFLSLPIPTLLVVAGLAFLGIAAVGKFSGKIDAGTWGRVLCGVFGVALIGIGLFINPSRNQQPTNESSVNAGGAALSAGAAGDADAGSARSAGGGGNEGGAATVRAAGTAGTGTSGGGGANSDPPVATPAPTPKPPTRPTLSLRIFSNVSGVADHPTAQVVVPDGWKIVAGGASANWQTSGSLLTVSYPADARTWVAASKDHFAADPATITAFALAINDPNDEWDVVITSAGNCRRGSPDGSRRRAAELRAHGWRRANPMVRRGQSPDRVVSARCNELGGAWEGPQRVESGCDYGLRDRDQSEKRNALRRDSHRHGREQRNPHPEAIVRAPAGFVMLGGGAKANWTGAGSLMTASFPSSDLSWTARSKDHLVSDSASLDVYAIVFK